MACTLPTVVLGARNLRIVFRFLERDGAGVLVPIDLTPAATLPGFAQAFFKKPGTRAVVMRPLVVSTPFTDGEAYYLTEDGFLDEAGIWDAQGAAMLDGAPLVGRGYFPSGIVSFEVLPFIRPFTPATQVAPAEPTTSPPALELPLVLPDPVRL